MANKIFSQPQVDEIERLFPEEGDFIALLRGLERGYTDTTAPFALRLALDPGTTPEQRAALRKLYVLD